MSSISDYFYGFSEHVSIRCGVINDEKYVVEKVPRGSENFDVVVTLDRQIAETRRLYTVVRRATKFEEGAGEQTLYTKFLVEATNKGSFGPGQPLIQLGHILTSLGMNGIDAKLLMGNRVHTLFVPADKKDAAVSAIKCTVDKVVTDFAPDIEFY